MCTLRNGSLELVFAPGLTLSRELVRQATLAASSHNTQPWKFRVAEQSITILPDFTRRTPVVDPDDHHLARMREELADLMADRPHL